MTRPLSPVPRTSLANDVTEQILGLIRSGQYETGDRLPAITQMARSFGVGHPTVREALRKLEVVGVVEIKHGSGVYVRRDPDVLLVTNPTYGGDITKKLLLDLLDARVPIETRAIELAATHATETHLGRMAALLAEAGDHLEDDEQLSLVNMAFHAEIAAASGNVVLAQLQEVLTDLFQREQRVILGIHGSRERDHEEHVGLLEAIRQRDATLATQRMYEHLGWVRNTIMRWDPARTPVD